MDYLHARPPHFAVTAVRAWSSGIVHAAGSWSAAVGTKTFCGHYLKHEPDYMHLTEFSKSVIEQAFPLTRVCGKCLRKATK